MNFKSLYTVEDFTEGRKKKLVVWHMAYLQTELRNKNQTSETIRITDTAYFL